MTLPFEIRYGRDVWRIDATTFKGRCRISIWPYYTAADGSLRPGKGGFQFAPDDAESVIAAIAEAAAQSR